MQHNRLNIAKVCCRAKGSARISTRHKLVSDVSTKATFRDSVHHSIPLNLLMVVKFVTSWNSTGVKVSDGVNVLPDRPDQVTFHDLHMVDVIEQLHIGRIYFLHHTYAPRCAIAHVVRM